MTSDDGKAVLPRAIINVGARAEVTAWANALHVTEQELTDAVARVGNRAREVITYLLKRGQRSAGPSGASDDTRQLPARRRRKGLAQRQSRPG